MARAPEPRDGGAKFTRGGTMGHVVKMTLTGAAGLTFMFLIDVATLFWVSRLEDETLLAALGFVWTLQFFLISASIGFAIAATALVSRSLGQGDRAGARRQATASLVVTIAVQTVLVAGVLLWRNDLLALTGAEGETREIAARFLVISLPAMPLMALGMTGGAVLRAVGDAWRSMAVTLVAGAIAMVLDPLFIFGLGFGMDGAAWAMGISRVSVGALALWYLIGVHDMLARACLADLRSVLRPFFAIAAPATLTQMSTPVGNALLTLLIAGFGDAAVAGYAVVSRLTVLAFGGIFALSGAIGGILGQNYGAGLMARVRATYRDAVIFCLVYTMIAWGLLFLSRGLVVRTFGLEGESAAVVLAFVGLAAGGFVFTGALFVANAAFNTLGRPLRSTALNWSRDGIVMLPMAWALSRTFDASGVIYGQALAGVVVGAVASWAAWRFIARLEPPLPARVRGLENPDPPLHHGDAKTA